MDYLYYLENNCLKNSSIVCCELVLKIKQYLNTLQIESTRLRGLQLECNELLDKFYPLKREFDNLIEQVLPIKYLGENDELLYQEHLEEFSTFVKNVWRMGKHKILEKGKSIHYVTFVGKPLSEMMLTIQNFVEELTARLSYMPYHYDCAATMQSLCAQVDVELQSSSLRTASACFRQYAYLRWATPFLQELEAIVNQYLLIPEVKTPKEFFIRIILQLPSLRRFKFEGDSDDMVSFRFVVDLLNGKLLGNEVLDQNADIKPVVEEDSNIQDTKIVMNTVQWIMQQYKCDAIPQSFKNFVAPITVPNLVERKRPFQSETGPNPFRGPLYPRSPKAVQQSQVEILDVIGRLDSVSYSPNQRVGRRGRKPKSITSNSSSTNDLQPINLQTLQSPILQPLI